MRMQSVEPSKDKHIGQLTVVKNFRRIIEMRDMELLNAELYEFLTLHCGFIAHFDIDGFKATYRNPRDFAEVFIRHFDRNHRHYNGIYSCHQEMYKGTGFTKAQIKKEFEKIVGRHKDRIFDWAKEAAIKQRYQLYLRLKKEFE